MLGGMGGMMGVGWQMFMRGYSLSFVTVMAGVALPAGALIILGAFKLSGESEKARMWGLMILIGSIVALFCIGGFGLGSILGIAAGAIAISKR